MMYRVFIVGETDGKANGTIEFGPLRKTDRPCYVPPSNDSFWWLSDEAHSSIGCHYRILYYFPHWIIETNDADRAILFKLAFGGR